MSVTKDVQPGATQEFPSTKVQQTSPSEFPGWCENDCKIINEGNKKAGEIIHFAQVHTISSDTDPAALKIIGKFQESILRKLIAGNFKVIASEKLPETIPQGALSSKRQEKYSEIKKTFPEGLPNRLSDEQLKVLAKNGADFVYAYLAVDVTLIGTATNQERQEFAKLLSSCKTSKSDAQEIIMDRRERTAMKHVMDYLKHNPNSKIALIYGTEHVFNLEDLSAEYKSVPPNSLPTIIRSDNSRLLQLINQNIEKMSESEQSSYLSASPVFLDYNFKHLKSEKLQIQALPLLKGHAGYYESAVSFRSALLKDAKGNKVTGKIEENFKEMSGPFAEFYLRSEYSGPNRISNLSPYQIGVLITHSASPAEKMAVALSAKSIPSDCFYHLPNSLVQELALAKIVPSTENSPNELLKTLLADTHSSDLGCQIRTHFKNRTGPFSADIWKERQTRRPMR